MAPSMCLERFDPPPLVSEADDLVKAAATKASQEAEAQAERQQQHLDALEQTVSAFNAAISDCEKGFQSKADLWLDAHAERLTHGLQVMMPSLGPDAAIFELGAEVAALVRHFEVSASKLRVNPDEHGTIAEVIAEHVPTFTITVESDSRIAAGNAELEWEFGGASLDANALAQRAHQLLQASLRLNNGGQRDDRRRGDAADP